MKSSCVNFILTWKQKIYSRGYLYTYNNKIWISLTGVNERREFLKRFVEKQVHETEVKPIYLAGEHKR